MRWPIRRVAVVGDSMLPTYRDGDWLLVVRVPVRVGDVVLARRPDRPEIAVVKRVWSIGAASVDLRGDNPDHSTDSRHFGAVPRADVLGRVLLRYGRGDPQRPGTT